MARQITYGTIATDASIVTLPMAKANSRIDFDEENDLLQLFVDAANAEIENYIGAPVLQREEREDLGLGLVDDAYDQLEPEHLPAGEIGHFLRQELDANNDGKVDTKIYFDAGKQLRAEHSAWTEYARAITRAVSDTFQSNARSLASIARLMP